MTLDPFTLFVLMIIIFIANLFGSSIGGTSMIVLPSMLLAGIPPHVTVATNRVYRIFASGAAGYKFAKNVAFDNSKLVLYTLISVFGGIIGALIVLALNSSLLQTIIAIALFVIAVYFLLKPDLGLQEYPEAAKISLLFAAPMLLLIAIYRAIIGSAAGTFLRAYLVGVEKFTFLQAATFSSISSAFVNLFASLVFVLAGAVDFWLAFFMIIAGTAGSYLGARYAVMKGNKFVKKLFLGLVIITSLRLMAGVFLGI